LIGPNVSPYRLSAGKPQPECLRIHTEELPDRVGVPSMSSCSWLTTFDDFSS